MHQSARYKYLIRCDFCSLIHDGYCDQLFLLKDNFFIVLSTILTKSFSKDTALLILRVITGTVLIHHGYEKLANIENFADAFVRPLHLPFPIFLSYIAAFSEIGGSWLLIIGLATRFGALAIVGTISVAIYHALVTSGFNIFLLELLLLYFASATSIALTAVSYTHLTLPTT